MTASFLNRALRDQTHDVIRIGRVARIDRTRWPYTCDVTVEEDSFRYEVLGCVIAVPFTDGNDGGLGVSPSPLPVDVQEDGQIVILLSPDGNRDGQSYAIGLIPDPEALAPAPAREADVAVPDLTQEVEQGGREYLEIVELEPAAMHVQIGPNRYDVIVTSPRRLGLLLSDEVEPVRVYWREDQDAG